MDKLTAIKIKYKDGTYSDEIPVGVLSENVEWDDTHTLIGVLGSIDVDAKGTIQDQIDKLSNNNTHFDTQLASINDDLNNFTNVLGNVDVSTKGTLQDQIDKLSNNNTQFDTQLASINDNLNDFARNFTNVLGNVDVSTKGTLQDQIDKLSAQGAGAHNSIYRGKNLGTSVTYKQWTAINAGTFNDLYIGDYWTIGGVNYRIAAFDYYLHTGDTECTAHHVVIVPDTGLYTAKMNNTNTTGGGYVGSAMYKSNLAQAGTTIKSAFGANHILTHRQLLVDSVANGASFGWAWFDSQIDLMNESMVYGHEVWSSAQGFDTGMSKTQLALFQARPDLITNGKDWWLRDVVSATDFANVMGRGVASHSGASSSFDVRPVFCIYQS